MSSTSPAPEARCQILIAAPNADQRYDAFVAEFRRAFHGFEDRLDFTILPRMADLPHHLAQHNTPHVLVVDCSAGPVPSTQSLKQNFASVRALDSQVCVLVLFGSLPSSFETMDWLDAGATALLQRDFSADQLTDGLRELLGKRLRFHLPRVPSRIRAPLRFSVNITCNGKSFEMETVNVGSGGLFLRDVPAGIKLGDSLSMEFTRNFSIDLEEQMGPNQPPNLDDANVSARQRDPLVDRLNEDEGGTGTALHRAAAQLRGLRCKGKVVWVRGHADRNGPAGLGVQFSNVSVESQKHIDDFVQNYRIQTFIAKA